MGYTPLKDYRISKRKREKNEECYEMLPSGDMAGPLHFQSHKTCTWSSQLTSAEKGSQVFLRGKEVAASGLLVLLRTASHQQDVDSTTYTHSAHFFLRQWEHREMAKQLVNSTGCCFKGPELSVQHPHQAAHQPSVTPASGSPTGVLHLQPPRAPAFMYTKPLEDTHL